MLYPNGRYMLQSPGRGFGAAPGRDALLNSGRCGDRLNRFITDSTAHVRTASTPDGYGMRTAYPPIRVGSMACLRAVVDLAMTGTVIGGGLIDGTGTLGLTPGGDLALIVALVSEGTFSLAGDNLLMAGITQLQATGTFSLDGTCNLGLIVPLDGTGTLTLSGTSDLRGLLSLEGAWSSFTELSPESLAIAVWSNEDARHLLTLSCGDVSDARSPLEKFDYGDSHADVAADSSGNRAITWS